MKKSKRIISLLLALIMTLSVFSIVPFTVGAVKADITATAEIEGDYQYNILEDGTAEITRYTGSGGDVTIPSTLGGYAVTSIGSDAFRNWTRLMSVTIPDSVTSISERAFSSCTGLTSVTIGNSVTNISAYTFYGCTSLTSVDIPDSVTSINDSAFYDCTGLSSVTIPDSVTQIGNDAFFGCKGLTSLTIGNSVESIGKSAFYDCTGLTSLTIPDSVTSIGMAAFFDCTGLTSLTIPNSVTSIGNQAFTGCFRLKSLTIPDSVTSIGVSAFEDAKGLTNLTIPDSVTSIRMAAFKGCINLTEMTIGNSVTSIGRSAFYDCTKLKSVTIPASVEDIGYTAFGYCLEFGYYDSKIDGFTIYGYTGSAAETYANDNGFTFIALSDKADSDTGVAASVTEDTELQVEDVTGSDALGNIQLTGRTVLKAYDISLIKDGEAVQPDHMVTVKIPCADETAKVYRVEADGSLTDMHAVYKDGYLVFTTDHFSVYVVATGAEIEIAFLGDADGSGDIESVDATFIQRYIAQIPTPFTKAELMRGDVDGSGDLELTDVTAIQYYLCHLKTPYPIGEPIA